MEDSCFGGWNHTMESGGLSLEVSAKSPSLRSFTMSLPSPSLVIAPFSHLTSLRAFHLGPRSTTLCDSNVVNALASLPLLESISVKGVSSDSFEAVTQSMGFPVLKSLNLYASHLTGVLSLLDFISSPYLAHITVTPQRIWRQSDYHEVFTRLSKFSSLANISCPNTTPKRSRSAPILLDLSAMLALEPLLNISNLQHLNFDATISGGLYLPFTSHEISRMASAWPKISSLSLTSPSFEFHISCLSSIHLFANLERFEFIAGYWIGADYLGIPLVEEGQRALNVKVLRIVGVTPCAEEDEEEIARYIVGVMPSLTEFLVPTFGALETRVGRLLGIAAPRGTT
ncbi:hypothetical protein JAAARDRAFT_74774 [Jaapia argillacea MUCL 33604]|uniref:F-box domain-containing protein n=1 Tax=Jaapia argillacea MUCL 33604 TaxID=933084 RepID=A0A067PFD5_9AGAM|nr:hypothetical protein JAAARDRAFT_74774 [Jaapia argillacea MUCL 33604]